MSLDNHTYEHRRISGYALWLKPENEVYDVLQNIISRLAETYEAPFFEPHITVAGSIPLSAKAIVEMMHQVRQQCEPMTLHLTETAIEDHYFRSLYVHIAPNEALLALRERCLTELRLEHTPYIPHVSLLYKTLDESEKRKIMEQVGSRFDLVFSPSSLYLMQTEGTPEQWKEVTRISLGDENVSGLI